MSNMDTSPPFIYEAPSKKVKSPDMIHAWEQSEAYEEYLGFIMAIGEAIKGKKIRDELSMSQVCSQLVKLLETLSSWVAEIPAVEMSARYGNSSYRTWFDKLVNEGEGLISELLPEALAPAVVELTGYFKDSFGNRTRIDYGTGHEMTFVMFLACLFKIGALEDSDRPAVGLKVFSAYMDLSRLLQTTYRMEPAGSQGVWSLDDYQFVSFIWGAAQLVDHPRLKPGAIPDPDMAISLYKDYHIFACLAYIHKVKTGPFSEHSNQLWNISAVQFWSKVYLGLIKMYRAEVLCKFPVIQHSLFGSVLTLKQSTNPVPSLAMSGNQRGPRNADPRLQESMPGKMPGSMDPMIHASMPGRAPGSMQGRMPGSIPQNTRFPGPIPQDSFPGSRPINANFPGAVPQDSFPRSMPQRPSFPGSIPQASRFPGSFPQSRIPGPVPQDTRCPQPSP